MKRTLPIILSLLAVSACSDNSEPTQSAIDGHWLHNPGQCELKLKTEGLFDLKIENGTIYVGDSKNPLPGEWVKHGESESIKDRAKEWLESCRTATFSSTQIDKSDVFLLSSPIQDVFFLELPSRWLMIDDNDVRLLLPFDDVKSMELPIEYPENSKPGGSTTSNNT